MSPSAKQSLFVYGTFRAVTAALPATSKLSETKGEHLYKGWVICAEHLSLLPNWRSPHTLIGMVIVQNSNHSLDVAELM